MRARWLLPLSAIAVSTIAVGLSCLPSDERPTPDEIDVSFSSSDATKNGFESSDGWSIAFDRVLVGVGNVSLDDGCTDYLDTFVSDDGRYLRLLDAQLAGSQKLSIDYGLGSCGVRVGFGGVDTDTVLGANVTQQELSFMSVKGSDALVDDRSLAIYVKGHATKGSDRKHFEWSFRPRRQRFDCGPVALDPNGNQTYPIDVGFSVDELFANLDEDGSPYVFDRIALADLDGDGEITFDELSQVVVPDPDGLDGGMADASLDAEIDGAFIDRDAGDLPNGETTLERFMYNRLLQRLLPSCTPQMRPPM
jgi:hypothetical protein